MNTVVGGSLDVAQNGYTPAIAAAVQGADVVIKATTSRGTQTTDTFSLKGIAQAVDRAAQACQ